MKTEDMSKKFQRTTEDFICEVCKSQVIGNGYTNHCPKCLYSKHVDINPGDRNAQCQGIMTPKSFESKSGSLKVVHVCKKCGKVKKNKISDVDDLDTVRKIMSENL